MEARLNLGPLRVPQPVAWIYLTIDMIPMLRPRPMSIDESNIVSARFVCGKTKLLDKVSILDASYTER